MTDKESRRNLARVVRGVLHGTVLSEGKEQRRSGGAVTTFVFLRSGESRPGTYPNFYSAVLYLQTLCHSAVTEPGHGGMGYSKEDTLVQTVEAGEVKVRKPLTRC